MISKDKPIERYFKQNIFFFDDIETIYQEIKEVHSRISILVNDKEIEYWNDLKNIEVKSLKINSYGNDINDRILLDLDEESSHLFLSDSSLEKRGVLSVFEELFSKTQKKTNFLYNHFFKFLIHCLIIFMIFFILLNIGSLITNNPVVLISSFLIFLIIYLYNIPDIKNRNVFKLNLQREEYSFYKENKKLITNFIVTGVVTVLTEVLKKLLGFS